MSYILDALKKSDRERKRGDIPNLQTIHIPITAEPEKPWMLYAFISVLLLSLAFVIGLAVSNSEPVVVLAATPEKVEILSPPEKIVVDILPVNAASEKEIKPFVSQIKATENMVETKHKTLRVNAQKLAEPVDVRPELEAMQLAAVKTHAQAKPLDLSEIPYLDEMADYLQQSVPQLNFAGHVYSTSRASRSVIINGVVMSEGDTVVQGIDVVEITASGVVFSLHDELFRIDILQDWSFE